MALPAAGPPLFSPRTPWRTRAIDHLANVAGRSIADMSPADIRRARAAVAPRHAPFTWVTGPVWPTVEVSQRDIPVRDERAVGLRIYRPGGLAGPMPMFVWIHGGGFVLGNVANYDPLCSFIAHATRALVISVDYRLAPEHPAPAGIHDCFDALTWLANHAATLGADPGRIAIGGDSAGGNLAAVTTQLLRDETDVQLAAQVLIYPVVDSTCLRRSKIVHSNGPILTRRETDTYFRLYLGAGPVVLAADDPLISPLLGRLDGLPPALVQTAGLDPLRDEGLEYGRRLAALGIETTVTNYPYAPHGFASFPGASKGAWPHRRELIRHLRRYLQPAS